MEGRLLEGQVALVTGGSRGIGAAVSRRLADHGAAVAISYRHNHRSAEAVEASIRARGGQCILAAADLEDESAPAAVVERIQSRLGPIDCLVHCAWPGWRSGAADEVGWSDFEIYLRGMVGTCQRLVAAAVPGMRRRHRGSVILLGTTAMYELNERHAAYVTAKGALLAFTRTLARDGGPDGVRVNMVSPGLVWTGEGEPPSGWGVEHARRAALGRLPTVDEVANCVLFLACNWSSAVTGAHLSPSCGLVMQLG